MLRTEVAEEYAMAVRLNKNINNTAMLKRKGIKGKCMEMKAAC
jgi:hypothetical protein